MTATDTHIASQPSPDAGTVAAVQPALSIGNVSHSYGPRRALIDVNFTVRPASFTALLGLNGAGKSTLFSLVTRLFGIQNGQIKIFGHDISRTPGEALRLMGVVFQPRTLDLDLSLTQNLLYHAALHGISRREARQRSAEVLGRIGLADRAGSKVRDLSGGQMRRLEIARALLHRPRLLLLDELAAGLNPAELDWIAGRIKALAATGMAIIVVEHLMGFIEQITDRVIVLNAGKEIFEGTLASAVREPQVIEVFLGGEHAH